MIFVWWIEVGFVLALGSKSTCSWCVGSKLTVCGPKMTCSWCGERLSCFVLRWSKLTWFSYAGRKSLGFSVGTEIGLVSVWVVEIDLIPVWGVDP